VWVRRLSVSELAVLAPELVILVSQLSVLVVDVLAASFARTDDAGSRHTAR
jgi:hypothetical protein